MAAFNLFLEKKSLKKKNKKKLYLNNLFQSKARASLHLTPPPRLPKIISMQQNNYHFQNKPLFLHI